MLLRTDTHWKTQFHLTLSFVLHPPPFRPVCFGAASLHSDRRSPNWVGKPRTGTAGEFRTAEFRFRWRFQHVTNPRSATLQPQSMMWTQFQVTWWWFGGWWLRLRLCLWWLLFKLRCLRLRLRSLRLSVSFSSRKATARCNSKSRFWVSTFHLLKAPFADFAK